MRWAWVHEAELHVEWPPGLGPAWGLLCQVPLALGLMGHLFVPGHCVCADPRSLSPVALATALHSGTLDPCPSGQVNGVLRGYTGDLVSGLGSAISCHSVGVRLPSSDSGFLYFIVSQFS